MRWPLFLVLGVVAVGAGIGFRMWGGDVASEQGGAIAPTTDSQSQGLVDAKNTIYCSRIFNLSNGGRIQLDRAVSPKAEYLKQPFGKGTVHILSRYTDSKEYSWWTGLSEEDTRGLFKYARVPTVGYLDPARNDWQMSIEAAQLPSMESMGQLYKMAVPKGVEITPGSNECSPVTDMSIFEVPQGIDFQTEEYWEEKRREQQAAMLKGFKP